MEYIYISNGKKGSRKKYWLWGKYYEYREAREFLENLKKEGLKWFIEEKEVVGNLEELFVVGKKYFLWINKKPYS